MISLLQHRPHDQRLGRGRELSIRRMHPQAHFFDARLHHLHLLFHAVMGHLRALRGHYGAPHTLDGLERLLEKVHRQLYLVPNARASEFLRVDRRFISFGYLRCARIGVLPVQNRHVSGILRSMRRF